MTNIERVTIVLSNPLMKSVTTAIERGAFVTSTAAVRRAAQLWSVAPARHGPTVAAPGIADDDEPDGPHAFTYLR
jgi:hypothetical protein